MDPKLFELLSDLTTAYRQKEDIGPEITQIEEMLEGINKKTRLTEKTLKIFEHIRKLKKPVTAHGISVRFHLAQSTSATHLRELHEAGLLNKSRFRNTTLWDVKSTSLPVAVPDKRIEARPVEPAKPEIFIQHSEPIQPVWPTNPFQTSYPHARGYDD